MEGVGGGMWREYEVPCGGSRRCRVEVVGGAV